MLGAISGHKEPFWIGFGPMWDRFFTDFDEDFAWCLYDIALTSDHRISERSGGAPIACEFAYQMFLIVRPKRETNSNSCTNPW